MPRSKSQVYPPAQPPDVTETEMSTIINQNIMLAELPDIDTGDLEQVRQRIGYYFRFCADRGIRPQLTQLALCLGVTRQSLWLWRKAGDKRKPLIDRAVTVLESMHNEWALTGKLNPATHIFLAKNWYQYQDAVQLEAITPERQQTNLTPEQIVRIISEDIPEA